MKLPFQYLDSRAENPAVYSADYVLCKRLFGLFGAFAVKVRSWWWEDFRGYLGG